MNFFKSPYQDAILRKLLGKAITKLPGNKTGIKNREKTVWN